MQVGFEPENASLKPDSLRSLTARVVLFEILLWTILAFLLAAGMRAYRPAPLMNDSYQYLNVAGNFLRGYGIATSLIHFDPERSHGRIPAPLTTFPPGYPFVIALAGKAGLEPENAARTLAALCFAATAGLLSAALVLTCRAVPVRRIVLLLFCANATAVSFATAVLTEPLYTVISTAAIVALLVVEAASPARLGRNRLAWGVLGGLLAGLSYWIRYAALFLVAGIVTNALLQSARRAGFKRRFYAAACLTSLLGVAALMLRNVAYVGTWRGGNDVPAHNPLKTVLAGYLRAQSHLFLGEHRFRPGVWEFVLLTGALAIAGVFLFALAKSSGPRPTSDAVLYLALLLGVYTAAMLYAGCRTMISFGPRMFVPVVPLCLILFGILLQWIWSRSARGPARLLLQAGLALTVAGYIGANARDLYEPAARSEDRVLAQEFAKPDAHGQPLRSWIDSHIGKNEPIAAEEGQATGYLLQRPTLSLVASQYSRIHWECDEMKQEMARFQARYLILYKPPPINIDEQELLSQSRFLASAAASPSPPCDFRVAVENPGVRILQRP